jgi:3-carboxy-cis,cis-muconate cycloisomerase
VYEACRASIETSRPLLDVLRENELVSSKISGEELERLCDPLNYMGCAQRMVDDVLQHKVD